MIAFLTVLARLFQIIYRSWRDPEFRGLFFLVILLLLGGTIFYSRVEGWTLLDSLYFSVITLTTIGYGDLYPTTAASKVFTILYIFIGLGIILAFLNAVGQRALERHRTEDGPEDTIGSNPEDAAKTGSRERE
ncbi:MAG: two pore domain potassium channel family protein [Rubrobacteraceae bacterium]|nr:two pore domain potassium channel family protein [Rubrobacteraceae bacterium]